ncbi:MAG: hypothetical protein LBD53_09650 [Tannerella sp.]|jgi:Golgi nucleoside diphosphatase|nr:hypothetical protein [Tannerella sp.]
MNVKEIVKGIVRKRPKNALVDAVMGWIAKEGYKADFKDGQIIFKVEGKFIIIRFDDNDKYYISFMFPRFYETPDEYKTLALYNMNYLNNRIKYAYLCMDEEGWVSVFSELTVTLETVDYVMKRMLGILRTMSIEFLNEINKGWSI